MNLALQRPLHFSFFELTMLAGTARNNSFFFVLRLSALLFFLKKKVIDTVSKFEFHLCFKTIPFLGLKS